jgi:hypothetical protein
MNLARMTLRGAVAGRALGNATHRGLGGQLVGRSKAAAAMIAVGLAGVLAFELGVGSAMAALPGKNGQIAVDYSALFSSGTGETQDHLALIDQDGRLDVPFSKSPLAQSSFFDGARAAFSPDGTRLAVGDYRGHLCITLVTGYHHVCLAPGDDPAWSPTGRRVFFELDLRANPSFLATVRVAGGKPRVVGEGVGRSRLRALYTCFQ